jgi:hypothetical protein
MKKSLGTLVGAEVETTSSANHGRLGDQIGSTI